MRQVWRKILAFLPFKCRICHQLSQSPEGICNTCLVQLPYRGRACFGCGGNLEELWVCGYCAREGRMFQNFYSPFYYQNGIAQLLRAWKYRGQLGAGQVLCTLMARACGEAIDWGIDCILPVPSDPRRFRERGFCTAHVLAEHLAPRISAPIYSHLLQSKQKTHSQITKSRMARLTDRRQTFLCVKSSLLIGKHVLLIDDVMTTGATLRALKSICLEAGCKEISALTLCVAP